MKKDLLKRYERICQEYVDEFCKKQGFDFIGWTAGQIGGVANCSNYYFHFQSIRWDIDSDRPKGLIVEWYNHVLRHGIEGAIDYFRYTKMLKQ